MTQFNIRTNNTDKNGCIDSTLRFFERIAADTRHSILLLSSDPNHPLGRMSVMAWDPAAILTSREGRTWRMDSAGVCTPLEGPPLQCLVSFLDDQYRRTGNQGIALGYLSYELGTQIERIPRAKRDVLGLPDYWIAFYDAFGQINHGAGDGMIVKGHGPLLKQFERKLVRAGEAMPSPDRQDGAYIVDALQPAWDQQRYENAFRRIRDYIVAGDIYQANLAHRFSAPFPGNAYALFARLTHASPAPFAAWLDCGGHRIISNSPECFLQVTDGEAITCPIKGTRPRSADAAEDDQLRRDLENSAKDSAEHVMIVDLERNDLGRVCRTGSIRVDGMKHVESFSRVHHLVSTVRGTLREDAGIEEILRATFPGGSITGAPKLRAMEIIAELEGEARGVYTGCIGVFGPGRDLNLSIAIRTAIVRDGEVHFHAGGGIVADSEARDEYNETFHKARAFMECLGPGRAIEGK